jgi:DNA-binding LytR/AlgR family response regulator
MNGYIPVIKARSSLKIDINEILYLEQYLRKTKILTENDAHETYSKIDDYVIYLGSNFLKCHRSLYVNMDKIISMKDQCIVFKNGENIYLSRDKFTAARQHFSRYILSNKTLLIYIFFSCNLYEFIV